MAQETPEIIEQDKFEFNVNPKDEIIIRRQFLGKTERDIEIENLPVPARPVWLHIIIRMIRYYQKHISKKLRNRCVFDPSCSHYSEMAFRKKGLIKGTVYTVKRLYSCRPKNGGVNEV